MSGGNKAHTVYPHVLAQLTGFVVRQGKGLAEVKRTVKSHPMSYIPFTANTERKKIRIVYLIVSLRHFFYCIFRHKFLQ